MRERLRMRLSLRLRLILAASTAVTIAVVLAAAGAYLVARHELRYQVDVALRNDAAPIEQLKTLAIIPAGRLRVTNLLQVIATDGSVTQFPVTGPIALTSDDREVAAGSRNDAFHDVRIGAGNYRVYTIGLPGGGAAELYEPLDAVNATLKHLGLLLALLSLGGIALATALGTMVARAALVPVNQLTAAAEQVAANMDLSASIQVVGVDEVARLGQALNALLAAVDQSQQAQRRLVADASHELRTPLTSMRTNLELLARSPNIPADERQAVLGDLVAQAAELSMLVGQLVDLEREPLASGAVTEVALDEVVDSALERARLHSPALVFVASLEPTTVMGQEGVLERAVANLLDNAAKWSPPGGQVEVNLVGGTLSVRDHGPGIDPADAPHVFDRFYRSARARSMPGSGLGLSIVRQAAEDHDGQAWILPAATGGTIACLRIPTVTPTAPTAPTEPAADAPATSPAPAETSTR